LPSLPLSRPHLTFAHVSVSLSLSFRRSFYLSRLLSLFIHCTAYTLQVERLWRDAKLLEIGGGTNEAHHKNMVRDLKRGGGKLL